MTARSDHAARRGGTSSDAAAHKMTPRIMAVVLALVSLNATAADEYRVKTYSCPTEREALACSGQCQRRDDLLAYEFKVNQHTSVVLRDVFSRGDYTGTFPISGPCRVVDSKNWTCEKNLMNFDWTSTTKETLRNGVWSQVIRGSKPDGSEPRVSASCGK
jgi:hypothetical protein